MYRTEHIQTAPHLAIKMFSTWKQFRIIKHLDPGRLGEKNKKLPTKHNWINDMIMWPPLHHQPPDGHKHAQYCTAYELFLLLEWIQDNKMWIKCGSVSRLITCRSAGDSKMMHVTTFPGDRSSQNKQIHKMPCGLNHPDRGV